MLVAVVNVTPRRVRLPQFEQCAADGIAEVVQYAPGNNDPLAEWFTIFGGITRQVIVQFADRIMAINRSGQFCKGLWAHDQRLKRRALDSGL